MIRPLFLLALVALILFPATSVLALDAEADQLTVTEPATPEPALSAEEAAKKERELKLYSDFTRFADAWVQRLNDIHAEGRSKMTVAQNGDKFLARFHLIEKKSAVVRESPSRPGQYTGILRYQDTLYQAEGETEAETRNGQFAPVPGTARAVSEIFQWMQGAWK